MKNLLSAKSILVTVLCFAVVNSPVYAKKTMYKWVDEKGKVSFSDQVPPDKAELGHKELDKNAQVIKESSKAKTKAELEIEKRLILLRKQQQQIIARQKAEDKKLLSNFLNIDAMNAVYNSTMLAFKNQDTELQENLKKMQEELASQKTEAASYEIKNKKIPPDLLGQIEENQKKINDTKQDIEKLVQKKANYEKKFALDKARYEFLTKSNSTTSTPSATVEAEISQPGLFSCNSKNAGQCEKAWIIAKEFVKANSAAKIIIDTDSLFMTEEPVTDTDLNLSISKMTATGSNPEIFLDIRCIDTVAAKALCSSSKAEDIRTQFTEYLKAKINTAVPAPAEATKK